MGHVPSAQFSIFPFHTEWRQIQLSYRSAPVVFLLSRYKLHLNQKGKWVWSMHSSMPRPVHSRHSMSAFTQDEKPIGIGNGCGFLHANSAGIENGCGFLHVLIQQV